MLHRTISLSLLAFGFAATAAAGPLDKARVGDQVTIPGFAYSGSKRITSDITLKRIDIYAPGAKIYEVRAEGTFEVPRSDKLMFVSDPAHTASRLYVVYDAKRGTFTGGVTDASGLYLIDGTADANGRLVVTKSSSPYERDTAFACGGSPSAIDPLHPAGHKPADDPVPAAGTAKGALRTAIIAIDTDNELLATRFTNNTANATTFIAEMFTAMNVFYERDLDVTLQQGTTFLRTSSPDPYPSTSATDTSDQLDEFGEYWRTEPTLTNNGTPVVPRTFAAMLSGKSTSGNSASGVAWLISSGNYCTATGNLQGNGSTFGHYSMTRVFTNPAFNGGVSSGIVGHELGHNFGAMHTHCSSATTGTGPTSTNTIDQCFNGESGCYSGTPTCPTDNSITGRGSVMSYCNFGPASGAGCGQVLAEFHPAHETFLRSRVQTNVNNGCMSLAGGAPSANLSVVKTSATTSAAPGAAVSFTITVANAGPDAAAAVQLADPTPSGLVFVSASGGCTSFPCSLGTINNGQQVVITANFTVSGNATAGATITNTATVSSSTTDPTPGNNSEGHSITVASPTTFFQNGFE